MYEIKVWHKAAFLKHDLKYIFLHTKHENLTNAHFSGVTNKKIDFFSWTSCWSISEARTTNFKYRSDWLFQLIDKTFIFGSSPQVSFREFYCCFHIKIKLSVQIEICKVYYFSTGVITHVTNFTSYVSIKWDTCDKRYDFFSFEFCPTSFLFFLIFLFWLVLFNFAIFVNSDYHKLSVGYRATLFRSLLFFQ